MKALNTKPTEKVYSLIDRLKKEQNKKKDIYHDSIESISSPENVEHDKEDYDKFNPNEKLTESLVISIREAIAYREHLRSIVEQLTNRNLAKLTGVQKGAIDRISSGKTWKHVK